MLDISFYLNLESRVWQALVDGDAAADKAMLTADFLGVYSTGFSDRAGHCGQLTNGPIVARFQISDARLIPLGPDRVLLAYHAEFTRSGNATTEAMYVSSIWENRDGTWLNTFSQDSATSGTAPV